MATRARETDTPAVLDVRQAADRLHLSVKAVYVMIREGQLRARRVGPKNGKILIDAEDVEKYWENALEQRAASVPVGGFKFLKPRARA